MPKHTPAQRRRWQATLIIVLFFLAVVAAAGTGWWYARESPPHQGPLVLISVESLPAGELRAYGAGTAAIATPALDALINDSILFAHAYTHSPQTLPAHASLLTGRLPVEHGVRDDAGVVLTDDVRTLAEQLRSRGFSTGAAVSSFLLHREAGVAQGFTFFDAQMPAAAGAPPAVTRPGVGTYDTAEQWMRGQRDRRYFLFLEIDAAAADEVVARLVKFLKDRRLYDDASIVFTSAHGDTDPQASLTDRALAVPLIVKQPDSEGAGRRVTAPVQHIDLLPTLMDLVRAPIPGGLRGRSLRPLLDAPDAVVPPQPIYSESLEAAWRFGGAPLHAITLDGYRLTTGPGEDLSVTWVGDTPEPAGQQTDSKRIARLQGALDQILAQQTMRPATIVPAAEATTYAAAGYIAGARTIAPVSPFASSREQAVVAAAHRAAIRMVADRQYPAAIAALRAIVHARPELAPVQLQLAALLLRIGRVTDALAAYQAAAQIRPDDPDIATQLAAAHLRTRQIEQARTSADEAVALAAKSASASSIAEAHEMAARVALAASDGESATTHAGEAEDADASLPLKAFVRGRIAYDEGNYEAAVTAFQEAVKVLQNAGRELNELHLYLGNALAQLDRHGEAETEFKEELRAFPDSTNAYSSLTMLYHASNRDDAAVETIEGLLAAVPTPEGYTTAVRLLTIAGQSARAQVVKAEARRRFRN